MQRSPAAATVRRRHAFTLVEMLVVIAIIGIMAAISVPAIKNFQKSDADAAAARQLLDDMARARQFAISQRSTVYMVFVPAGFWTDPAYTAASGTFTQNDRFAVTNLLDKQLIGYNFISLRAVGEQPGQSHPKYLSEWRTLPEGTFVAQYKFVARNFTTQIPDPNRPAPHGVVGFAWTNCIPFPTADTLAASYVWLPYIAFNHQGQVISEREEEVIPLARGTANPALDVNKKPVVPFAPPTLTEKPPGNSTNSAYTLIYVDRLTGRAHIERQQLP